MSHKHTHIYIYLLGALWRCMFKSEKAFESLPAPLSIARATKADMEAFRAHMPLVECLCVPGLKERHWAKMSKACVCVFVVEFDSVVLCIMEVMCPQNSHHYLSLSLSLSRSFFLSSPNFVFFLRRCAN